MSFTFLSKKLSLPSSLIYVNEGITVLQSCHNICLEINFVINLVCERFLNVLFCEIFVIVIADNFYFRVGKSKAWKLLAKIEGNWLKHRMMESVFIIHDKRWDFKSSHIFFKLLKLLQWCELYNQKQKIGHLSTEQKFLNLTFSHNWSFLFCFSNYRNSSYKKSCCLLNLLSCLSKKFSRRFPLILRTSKVSSMESIFATDRADISPTEFPTMWVGVPIESISSLWNWKRN